MKFIIITLIFFLNNSISIVFSQDKYFIDSLLNTITNCEVDSIKIKTYIEIGNFYEYSTPDTALYYYLKALKNATKQKNDKLCSESNSNIGNVYLDKANYSKATEYYIKALKTAEEINDKEKIAYNKGNIGIVNLDQENFAKSLDYFFESIAIYRSIENKYGEAMNLGNIGLNYFEQNKNKKALKYYLEALEINKENDFSYFMAANYANIGLIYESDKEYDKALNQYKEALKLFESIGYFYEIAHSLINLSRFYNEIEQYESAIIYANKSLILSNENNNLEWETEAYLELSNAFRGMKNYSESLKFKDLWFEYKDSLFNIEKVKSIADINIRYETEKKEKQIIEQQAEIKTSKLQTEKEKLEKEKQINQRNFFLVAFILILMIALLVYRFFRQNKKSNLLLLKQKKRINNINDILSKKNIRIESIHRKISESIDYAARIQKAILPSEDILKKYLSEHFVLFKPKDKVSGDFYWWSHIENHTVITAADSTGHGVPGAFMSIFGSLFLREIVQKEKNLNTGDILCKLRTEIIATLKQTGKIDEQKDGIDMAIVSIDHETNILQYSGANNPLYLLSKRKINGMKLVEGYHDFYEIKPDKMPIAIYERMDKFSSHKVELKKGDIIYLFSDGYRDQFGGPNQKKIRLKLFRQLLYTNKDKPLEQQKIILNHEFQNWKGSVEQTDDVLLIGLKI